MERPVNNYSKVGIAFMIGVFLTTLSAKAQSTYQEFARFVSGKYVVPEAIKTNCSWQYAIVKVSVNKSGRASGIQILQTNTEAPISESFDYIKEFDFKKYKPGRAYSLIFCMSIENIRMEMCDFNKPIIRKHPKPTLILNRFKSKYKHKLPGTTFLHDNFMAVIQDPVK